MKIKMCPLFVWGLCVALTVDFTTAHTEESSTSYSNTTPVNIKETQPGSVVSTDDHVRFRSAALPTEKDKDEAESSRGTTVGLPIRRSSSPLEIQRFSTGASLFSTIMESSTQDQSASTYGDVTPPATLSNTVSAFPSQPTSLSQLQSTSEDSSNLSSGATANISVFTQSLSSLSSSAPTASGDIRSTPVMHSTSTMAETSTISTESQTLSISSMKAISKSTHPFTSTSSLNFTSSPSTSPARIIIPVSKRLPDQQTTSTPKSTTQRVSKSPTSDEDLPFSTYRVVKQCLMVIAVLAVIATIFIICTVALCVRLSVKKRHNIRRSQQGTEMMCISTLLPDRNPSYRRHRNPVPNGVLVIPRGGDSDEDGSDTFTLSSFLPENDRFVSV